MGPLGNIECPLVHIGSVDGLTIFHVADRERKTVVAGLAS